MIPIYICDDNAQEREYVNRIIQNLVLIEGYAMEIALSTENPQKLLEHRLDHGERSVYFLDVDLKNEAYNGFTLAKKLREADPRGFVVFVTTHEEMIYETFKYRLEAMGYITKDNPERMAKLIRDCLKEINALCGSNDTGDTGGYYTVKIGDSNYQIPIKDILCFETTGAMHRIVLRTASQRLEFRGDLNAVEKELDKGFLKIHRSYLVQLSKIQHVSYAEGTLLLEDDSVCLISRSGKKRLREYFEPAAKGDVSC